MQRRAGFTIVELLIVIVVIGILAVIALGAFNESQRHARNSQTFSLANAYRKALVTYAVDHGQYPTNASFCLGRGYPDVNGDTTGDCRYTGATPNESENFTVLQALTPYIDTTNTVTYPAIVSGTEHRRGAAFTYLAAATLDGQPHPWWTRYTVEGSSGTVKCQAGPAASISGTYPNFSSSPPSSGSTGGFGSSGRECWIPLPNPATL